MYIVCLKRKEYLHVHNFSYGAMNTTEVAIKEIPEVFLCILPLLTLCYCMDWRLKVQSTVELSYNALDL
jgi:hypothetical protein